MTPNNVRGIIKGKTVAKADHDNRLGDTETCPLLDKETIITIDYVSVTMIQPLLLLLNL